MSAGVSVVVPVLDAAPVIDECVGSLLELRHPEGDPEIVVVDNGSTDGTLEALRAYGDRMVLLHESRRGAAAARNAGVAGARGDLIAFTDADCTVEPGWLSLLIAPLEDQAVGIAGGTILARQPANEVERFGEVIHDHRSAIDVYEPPYAITMNWASRRSVLEELGGFDEDFIRCQDVDLSYRVVQAGYEITFVPDAVVHHRNERTLRGLFHEGFTHGFHGVRARRRHAEFLRGHGHEGTGGPRFAQIRSSLSTWARERDPNARCDAVFNSGKKAGTLLGSARFRG